MLNSTDKLIHEALNAVQAKDCATAEAKLERLFFEPRTTQQAVKFMAVVATQLINFYKREDFHRDEVLPGLIEIAADLEALVDFVPPVEFDAAEWREKSRNLR